MSSNKFDIFVIGSCMTDLICYSSRLPKAGETIHATKFETGFGGKGANQCVAVAKLGASCAFLAKLGNDSYGVSYLNYLKTFDNIDLQHVTLCDDVHSGIAQIIVGENGENSIVIAPGANTLNCTADVDNAENIIRQSKVVLFQFEIPLDVVLHSLKLCEKYNCISIVNAAPAFADLDSNLIRMADIFCVNEVEAEAVTGIPVKSVENASCAIVKLRYLGSKFPIITLGSMGVVFIAPGQSVISHIPVVPVQNVVDTTGAGDSFIGTLGFILAKYPDLPAEKVIQHCVRAASFTVQRLGTQTSYPDKDDPFIIDLLKDIQRDV